MKNGWKETKHGLDVDNSAQRTRLWKIQRDDEIKCIYSVARKKGKGWSPTSAVQYRVVLKINDDKGGWRKRPDERKHSLEKITAWSCDMQGHAENALRDVANWQKTCLLFNRWYHRASTITWYHWKTKAIRGNIFHRHLLLYRTRDRLPMRVRQKERSRHIRIWTSGASVQPQFLECVCPHWGYNRINSFSFEQRMVSRSGFGIYCGRIGLFRIHSRQAPIRIWNSGFRDCPRNLEDYFRADFQRKNNVLEETQIQKRNVQCIRTGKLCFKYFLQH